MKYIGIDIGGTWIKGVVIDENMSFDEISSKNGTFDVVKIQNTVHSDYSMNEWIDFFKGIVKKLKICAGEIRGIGMSTSGIVNYSGTEILKSAEFLRVLRSKGWNEILERELKCKITLINDADAATIGLAEIGALKGNKTIGVAPIGTGLGFTVWRNGRLWRPGKCYTLIGSIETPTGSFDTISSASKLAQLDKDNDLIKLLTHFSFKNERGQYFQSVARIIQSASVIYNLDKIIICGGLSDAANSCDFPLAQTIEDYLHDISSKQSASLEVIVSKEGNSLQLVGALSLAKGESIVFDNENVPSYSVLSTERPYREDVNLHTMPISEIVETFWYAEQEAGNSLRTALPVIAKVIKEAVERIRKGGRLIYIGAGSSGRIAAIDAIELPCTYGFPEDKALAVISGGIADAAIEIESNFEEDASAVPDMLLLKISSKDVVIGISASGTAYFVQSALAFAKYRGGLSILLQAEYPEEPPPFCNSVIPLYSGSEVVAGSTRLKAGTATKKVLNCISSAIMIKLGKVEGPYMIDVACSNRKLVERALGILKNIYGIDKESGMRILRENGMNLFSAIQNIRNSI